jgi:saccharopine dehydrogenase-like NADP-dependent oxidoreductase
MARCREIDRVVVGDVAPGRAKALASSLGSDKLEGREVDASDPRALRLALKGIDLAINAAHAAFDLPLMGACLEMGVNYMDLSSMPEAQLPQDGLWKDAGLFALIGVGEDPGISNALARYASGGMEEVEAIRIRDADVVLTDQYPLASPWSPDTFLAEVFTPPIYWDRGMKKVPPLSGREVYTFPDPVGPRTVYLMEHEEPVTLPHFIPGVAYCDLKLFVDDRTLANITFLNSLGLLSRDPIEVKGAKVAPRDLLLTLLPQPVDLAGKVDGHSMLVVEVAGVQGGEKVVRRLWTGISHHEAFSVHNATATAYMTGTGTGIFATMFARGLIRGPGVIAPECLDPGPVLLLMEEMGIPAKEEVRVFRDPTGKAQRTGNHK